MPIEVSMTGSGEIGPVKTGWNVQEFATPVTPGDLAGGTGSVSFSAGAKDDSLFIVNNTITTIEPDLGTVSGVVKSVAQTGLNVNVGHDTQLSLLDAQKTIPALGAGGIVPAVDLCTQLSGRDKLLGLPSGLFYSLKGHSAGFDVDGVLATAEFESGLYQKYDPSSGTFYNVYYNDQSGLVWGNNFAIEDDKIWATKVVGDTFVTDTKRPSSRVAFKTLLTSNSVTSLSFGTYVPTNNQAGTGVTFTIDPISKKAIIDLKYTAADIVFLNGANQSIAGLDLTKELAVFIEYRRPVVGNTFVATIIVCNTSNYANKVTATVSYFSDVSRNYQWQLTGKVRSLYRTQDTGLPASGTAVTRRNYVKNPSFETNVAEWTATGATVAQSLAKAFSGTKSMLVAASAGGFVEQAITAPLVANEFYVATAMISAVTGSIGVQTRMTQYDAAGNVLKTNYGSVTAGAVGWWTTYNSDVILPQTVRVNVSYHCASGGQFYIDAVMLTEGTQSATYFDGSTTPTGGYTYAYDVNGYSVESVSLSDMSREYELAPTYVSSGTVEINGPVPAVTMNMWEYLQNACTAYGQEISLVDDILTVRDTGTNIIDISNIVASPTITPAMILSGRHVEMVYSNAYPIDNGELYSAREDSNRIISVKYNEIITTTVSVTGTPTVIYPPTRSTTPPNGAGQYCISASDGLQVGSLLWERYGGKLQVAISATVENAIDITLTGPTSTIPGVTGPFSLAYSDGGTQYGALSIKGSGVKTANQTLKLLTGADQTKVTQDVAKTITNPFVNTLEQAYDRGLWLAANASGPQVRLSGTISVNNVEAFGLVAGSLVFYRDSTYRITDATIGNLGVSFNAVRHVTVFDFDVRWYAGTVGDHDTVWLDKQTSDHTIQPYRERGELPTLYIVAEDTDGTPYITIYRDQADASLFLDTDGVPYYSDGFGQSGSLSIAIDTDLEPYYY